MTNPDRLIPVEEAALRYGAPRDLFKAMVAAGFFPFAARVGQRYVIERVPFEQHLAPPSDIHEVERNA